MVGGYVPAQGIRIETAICMSNKRDRQRVDPGIEAKLPFSKFRQLVVVAARKVFSNLSKLLFNDMEVVDQPISGRRDSASLFDGSD